MTAAPGALGILGGTFDPIHFAHLAMAEQARQQLGLRGVVFVPSGMPPHKRDRLVTPPSRRVAMVELAVAGDPWFTVDRREVERSGPSFAVDTLASFVAEGEEPVFILSAEALRGLPTWRQPERVVELARIAVVPRGGARPPGPPWLAEHFPGREGRFMFVEAPALGHSGTEIRRMVAEGRSIRFLVPPAVEAYIREHDLYGSELWRKN